MPGSLRTLRSRAWAARSTSTTSPNGSRRGTSTPGDDRAPGAVRELRASPRQTHAPPDSRPDGVSRDGGEPPVARSAHASLRGSARRAGQPAAFPLDLADRIAALRAARRVTAEGIEERIDVDRSTLDLDPESRVL